MAIKHVVLFSQVQIIYCQYILIFSFYTAGIDLFLLCNIVKYKKCFKNVCNKLPKVVYRKEGICLVSLNSIFQ